jgi:hypothetical protein
MLFEDEINNDVDFNVFDEFLECVSPKDTTSASAVPQAPPFTPTIPVNNVVPTASAVAPNPSDFNGIIESLSPELKLRFIDKLAEAMANQLASSVGGPMAFAQVEATVPEKESVLNSKAESSYPTFMLPSGSQAPDIALPLASAALGAFFMSSLQSLKTASATSAAAAAASVSVKDQMATQV